MTRQHLYLITSARIAPTCTRRKLWTPWTSCVVWFHQQSHTAAGSVRVPYLPSSAVAAAAAGVVAPQPSLGPGHAFQGSL